jgi:bifunctional non-homologous end joining protein LigD
VDAATGKEKFTPCQRRCSTQYPDPYLREQFPVKMETFDILEANGLNVERKPYYERKDMLYKLLAVNVEDEAIEYVSYEKDLPKAWHETVEKDREGLIVKRIDAPYEHDRSFSWLKVKNWRFEVCNIVGYTPGERSRSYFFGSLVLERNGQLRGCAGTGFNDWELRKFKDLFSNAPKITKPYADTQVGETYTAKRLDNEVLVKYYQTTDEGKVMRFPIFVAST